MELLSGARASLAIRTSAVSLIRKTTTPNVAIHGCRLRNFATVLALSPRLLLRLARNKVSHCAHQCFPANCAAYVEWPEAVSIQPD